MRVIAKNNYNKVFEKLHGSLIIPIFIMNYFNSYDIENPIQSYSWLHELTYFDALYYKIHDVFFSQNKYTLNDGIFRSANTGSGSFIDYERNRLDSFYQYNDIDLRFGMVTFNFYLSEITHEYERTVESMLDIFGTIGGIYELIEIIAAIFVGFFASRLFYVSSINKYNSDEIADLQDSKKEDEHSRHQILDQSNLEEDKMQLNSKESSNNNDI